MAALALKFARGVDGARIAYECAGEGPPLVLLHGGFIQDRRAWWTAGYVDRLKADFRVLALDIRGHGESDRPATPSAYGAREVCADVTAVLDAERVARAHVWGFSLGASIALQLVRDGDRVDRAVVGGAVLGPWLTEEAAKKMASGMRALSAAKKAGTLDELAIPAAHKDFARKADLDVAVAFYGQLPAWPLVELAHVRRPTFFYAGSENPMGAATIRDNEAGLRLAGASWAILPGLDHMGEFAAIDAALPPSVQFLRQSGA